MHLFKKAEYYTDRYTIEHGANFSGRYSFSLAYDEFPAEIYESLINTKTPWWLDTVENTRVIIATDGTCGSTCACFALRASESAAALVVGLGGVPNSTAQMAAAAFPGGSVMRTSYTDLFNLTA